MVGVLERTVSRRRRFADGGGAGAPPQDSTDQGTQDQGALAGAAPGPATYDTIATPETGALSRGQTQQDPQDAQRLSAMQRAMTVLQASHTTNLPMLAAAGALLAPTRTGSFSESLGNAFQAAVPVTEQERKLQEDALLRAAQVENNALWRQGMLGVNQQRANSYGQRTEAMSVKDAAIAARQTALANADPHARPGDLMKATIDATVRNLVGKTNPDTGQPWTADEATAKAWDTVKGLDITRQRADTTLGNSMENLRHHEAMEGQGDDRIAMARDNAAAARQIRQQALAQSKDLGDRRLLQTATDVDLVNAARIMGNAPGTKWADALNMAQSGRSKIAPPAPAAGAPAAGGASPSSGSQGTAGNPVAVKTPQEAAALAPGTYFMVPGETVPRIRGEAAPKVPRGQ